MSSRLRTQNHVKARNSFFNVFNSLEYMDDLYSLITVAVVCLTIMGLGVIFGGVYRDAKIREVTERARRSQAASGYRRVKKDEVEPAGWVGEVLGLLNLDTSILYDEKYGETISQFLPMVRAYIAANPDALRALGGGQSRDQQTLADSGYI